MKAYGTHVSTDAPKAELGVIYTLAFVKTLKIRTVEATGSNIFDSPILPELLNQIPSGQDICSVTADGAYDTHKCYKAIAARGAHAVVLLRKNAKP
jgi:hypothetical protein